MEHYTFLRQLADSWGLLLMALLFLGVCIFVFRPGSRKLQDEAANSIFRDDRHPAPVAGATNSNRTEA
jgi:cytochrome c oxidase cbb3-type subunit 4